MTVFIGVDGAVQHGLSMIGILLILVCSLPIFLLMFIYSHFSTANGRWRWRDVVFLRS